MAEAPVSANPELYAKLANQGYSKGEAQRLANEKPAKAKPKAAAKPKVVKK